ncbi:MAG: glycosyltransferase family 1 protein [Clostridiales bacterium]|nr:glycosyltransferase family 1 protein [Clostridiales bacterium]
MYLACSKKAGQWLYGDIGDRLTLVPNGIKVSDFAFNLEKRIATRSRLRLEEGQVALGHVGRLAEVKNHKFLLGVFAAFRSKQPNSTLLLVGEGPLEEELKDECKFLGLESEVRFLGYREDVADLIQAFDVFVLPSFSEGFPITLVEAQACGLPCVVADNITQEVDITGLVSFVSLENSAERWAELIEERLAGDRASSEYITKLQNAGYTDEAATRIILKIFGGEI